MDKISKQPNILFFKEIYKKNLIPCINIVKDNAKKYSVYSPLPVYFTSVREWPSSSNLKCWNCECSFSSFPKFIPVEMEYNDATSSLTNNPTVSWGEYSSSMSSSSCDGPKYKYKVCGNFCSWNCAVGYLHSSIDKNAFNDCNNMLYHIYRMFHNDDMVIIKPSPPKTIMSKFCGNGISEEQYQEMLTQSTIHIAVGN